MDMNLIAPCGIDCANCDLFEANGNTEAWCRAAARRGGKPGDFACKGCRKGNGCVFFSGCETLACVREKGVDYCSDCASFPCVRVMPLAEGASFYPHNMKMYNLAVIKSRGPEALLSEAMEIRKRYYKGKFRIGSGPVLEEQNPEQ